MYNLIQINSVIYRLSTLCLVKIDQITHYDISWPQTTKYGNNYNNMANWFKIILMAQIFYEVYKKKINDELLITILILFVFCNINYYQYFSF